MKQYQTIGPGPWPDLCKRSASHCCAHAEGRAWLSHGTPSERTVAQTVTQDGIWCASAQLRPGVGAFGDGPTQEDAIADLRAALKVLIDEVGPPDELTLTLNVA